MIFKIPKSEYLIYSLDEDNILSILKSNFLRIKNLSYAIC